VSFESATLAIADDIFFSPLIFFEEYRSYTWLYGRLLVGLQ